MERFKKWLTKVEDRKALIYCLALSFLFWLLIKLSHTYSTTIQMPVSFRELPDTMEVMAVSGDELDLQVTGHGYGLIRHMLNPLKGYKVSFLKTRKNRAEGVYLGYQLTSGHILNLQDRLPDGVQVKSVLQDSIWIQYSPVVRKDIELRLVDSIRIEPGHVLRSVKITPDTLKVKGPAYRITSLDFIPVKGLNLPRLKSSKSISIDHKHLPEGLDYTEGNLQLDIEVLPLGKRSFQVYVHPPDGFVLLPNHVLVEVTGPIDVVEAISSEDFDLGVELKEGETSLEVLIQDAPDDLTKLSIRPARLEFLKRSP